MTNSNITHDELVGQAEAILSAIDGTMYYSVAHGEAARLQNMIEEMKNIN